MKMKKRPEPTYYSIYAINRLETPARVSLLTDKEVSREDAERVAEFFGRVTTAEYVVILKSKTEKFLTEIISIL